MLSINWSDVVAILNTIQGYLIAIGVIIVLAIVLMIACRKLKKTTRYTIRFQSVMAMIAGIVIVANMICIGPMSAILTLASGGGTIDEETSEEAFAAVESIADEGFVLMQNDDSLLPLEKNSNVNVFGWASAYPCYGGTGSGSLNDAYHITDLIEGLQNAGFNTNTELTDFYKAYREGRPEVGMWAQDWTLPEPTADSYTDEMMASAKEFSDTAIIVLTRTGGEHIDLPQDVSAVNYTDNSTEYQDFPEGTHYLEPSQTELNMIDLVCANFDNVVLVVNSSNTMELNVVDQYDQIKSVIWAPGPGQNGFDSLGKILCGDVNPSGKTTDTFARDLTASLSWNNFGDFQFDNMSEYQVPDSDPFMPGSITHFVRYTEGIYVGYKFYETAAAEGLINYEDAVQYPFGHGESYTTFTQEMGQIQESNGQISVDVTVTNTGDVAGKEIVEVYYNPPYTNGGIEKASANLAAFDKTDELAPGESQTLTITFDVEDMASYDTYGEGCYVLEAGDYIISINEDSHTIIDSQVYSVGETIVYNEDNARSTDETAAVNAFADFTESSDEFVTYLSRADGFANYAEAAAAPVSYSMPEADKEQFVCNYNWTLTEDSSVEMPATNAGNDITLADMRGKSYDDADWDTLLDNMDVEEVRDLIALGGYQTLAVDSMGKVSTVDCDGPASINNNFTGVGSVGFQGAVMIANTWNTDLALLFGERIGDMADQMDVSGWYAPAVNTHRCAFAGRNFEYFSEDGVLAGNMASAAVQGAQEYGVYAYIKHFALNDQETNRWGMLTTWATEQSIREIYLKPFEIVIKDNTELGGAEAGYPLAVMSSYNYIGSQWAGACDSLLNTVLRDEWGFNGFVLTDYFADFGYMDATRSIYNGGDLCLINYDITTNWVNDTSATTISHMRTAAKHTMYTIVNSRAYATEASTGLLTWQIILIAVDIAVAALIILLELLVFRKGYSKRKEQ